MRDDTLQLTEDGLPATFTVGERTYRIHTLLEGVEASVNTNVMRERGVKMGAAMTEEDGKHILTHQDEIPREYRGKIRMVFPDWCTSRGDIIYLACGVWWFSHNGWFVDKWEADVRLVSRES